MLRIIRTIDSLNAWIGKVFAWCILVMTIGMAYEVFVRYLLRDPTAWAYDISYIMYGTLFMMAGAYTLSRDGHVRGDFLYRLWKPRTQAKIELVLYFLFFYPGVLALIFAGWKFSSRSWGYFETSINSPADVPIFHFKSVIVAAGICLAIQGVAQICRCVLCIQTGEWPAHEEDVEELEEVLLHEHEKEVLRHGTEAIDVVKPLKSSSETIDK